MKKLITTLVVFALVAGTVFAQVTVGGNVQLAAHVISGSNAEGDDHPKAGMSVFDTHANVGFGDKDSGGMLRLWQNSVQGGPVKIDWTPDYFAKLWWKPIPQLRLQLGKDADGEWGHAQITGWGFNAEAQNGAALDQHRGLNDTVAVEARTAGAGVGGPGAWAPGFNGFGATVEVTPITGLAINLAVPFGFIANASMGGATAASQYTKLYMNINYFIMDIGTIRLSSQFGPGYKEGDADKWYGSAGTDDPMSLWLAFHLIAIDNMGAEVGFGYRLPGADGERKYPVNAGVGFSFRAEDFLIKLRTGLSFAGSDGESKDDFVFGVNILPSYNLGFMTAFFNAGIGMRIPDGDADTHVDWYINPYIRKDVGGVRLYAGFKLFTEGTASKDDPTVLQWGVPLQLQCYF